MCEKIYSFNALFCVLGFIKKLTDQYYEAYSGVIYVTIQPKLLKINVTELFALSKPK